MSTEKLLTRKTIRLTLSNKPADYLASRYGALPGDLQTEFKKRLKEVTMWSNDQWFNKINHRTALTPLEQIQIDSIFNDLIKEYENDNSNI